MSNAKSGDKVRVHYTGSLSSGEIFDSSKGRDPLEFVIGAGMMIKGFDSAVNGMAVGESKTATLSAEDAYGEKREDMIFDVPRANFPPDITPEVGLKLAMNSNDQQVPVTIVEVSDDQIKLDANHELAGKELVFEIELVEIV
ncbi:MAG: peptidylprolyl isomerase [Cyclobacteriaceae bacterium]|nr:peptidylprolyl isomerase [Cyclobacteriaceae bacterium]